MDDSLPALFYFEHIWHLVLVHRWISVLFIKITQNGSLWPRPCPEIASFPDSQVFVVFSFNVIFLFLTFLVAVLCSFCLFLLLILNSTRHLFEPSHPNDVFYTNTHTNTKSRCRTRQDLEHPHLHTLLGLFKRTVC